MDESTVRRIVREELARAVDSLAVTPTAITSGPVVEFAGTVPPGEYRAAALYERFKRWWEDGAAAGPCPSVTMFGRRVKAHPRVVPQRRFNGRWYVVGAEHGA